jgi:hypothetical protein
LDVPDDYAVVVSSWSDRGDKRGAVYLDLGRPRNQRWVLPLLAVMVLLIGLGVAWATGWDRVGIMTAVTAVATAGVSLFSQRGGTELRERGVLVGGQFFAWTDLTSYRFWEAGMDFTARVSAPLNVQELAGGLAFGPEMRPQVEEIVGRMTPHIPKPSRGRASGA